MGSYVRGMLSISAIDAETGNVIEVYGPEENKVVDVGVAAMWQRLSTNDDTNQYQFDSLHLGNDYGDVTKWTIFNPEPASRSFTKYTQTSTYSTTNVTYEHPRDEVLKVSTTIVGSSFMDDNFPTDSHYKFTSMSLRFKNGEIFSFKRFPVRSISRFINIKVDWRFYVINADDLCYPNVYAPTGLITEYAVEPPAFKYTVMSTSPTDSYFFITPIGASFTVKYKEGEEFTYTGRTLVKGYDYGGEPTKMHQISITSSDKFYVESFGGGMLDLISIDDWGMSILGPDCQELFSRCHNLKDLPEGVMDLSEATNCLDMLSFCNSLTTVPRVYIRDDITVEDFFESSTISNRIMGVSAPNVTDGTYMFYEANCDNISNVYMPNLTNGYYMFYFSTITDTTNFVFGKLVTIDDMFEGCYELSTLGYMDMSDVTSADYAFYTAGIKDIQPMSFDSLTYAGYVFNESAITNECLAKISFPAITSSNGVFMDCHSLGPNLTYSDSFAADIYDHFWGSQGIITVDSINLPNVSKSTGTLASCINLETVNDIQLPLTTDVSNFFDNCQKLTTVNTFNAPVSTYTKEMFLGCTELTTITDLTLGNISNAVRMFKNCSNLTSIPDLDFDPASTASASFVDMFLNCTSLSDIGRLNGLSATFSLATTACSYDSLVKIADSVGTVSAKIITLTGTPAVSHPDYNTQVTVLQGKGWTVVS